MHRLHTVLRDRWSTRAGTVRAAAAVALASALAVAVWATPALAHEEAVIESPSASVAAGDSLLLTGKEFSGGGTYQLRLLGALDEHELGEVTADTAGLFSRRVPIARDVRPGLYQVVAVASDGDVVARLDMTVLSPADVAGDVAHEGGIAHQAGEARADEIRIVRERSGIEWALIGIVIGLSGGLGIGLFRRRSTA